MMILGIVKWALGAIPIDEVGPEVARVTDKGVKPFLLT